MSSDAPMPPLPEPDYRRLSDLQSGVDEWYGAGKMHSYARAHADKETAELRADAMRYRWLREVLLTLHFKIGNGTNTHPILAPSELDHYCDSYIAAMAEKP